MQNYQFPHELASILSYYQTVNNSLSVSSTSISGLITTSTIIKPPVVYLQQSIPIMFCMAWEKFRNELKAEPAKFRACFEKRSSKLLNFYYNNEVTGVFLLRNCIVHTDMNVSEEYEKWSISRYKKGSPLLPIDDIEIYRQYRIFINAYERISTNSSLNLP